MILSDIFMAHPRLKKLEICPCWIHGTDEEYFFHMKFADFFISAKFSKVKKYTPDADACFFRQPGPWDTT